MSEALHLDSKTKDLRFFRNLIFVMAIIVVAGFVKKLVTGRSSFSAPLIVHMHAVVFMGWIAILLLQVSLISSGRRDLHRRLGVLALVWSGLMMVLGVLVTVAMAHNARIPFFFQPQYFLIADPATLLSFIVMLIAAVALRRQPDWHARLQIGAFAMLMDQGVARLLPLPQLMPYAFQTGWALTVLVPIIGMVRDWRVYGRPHRAWLVSIGVLALAMTAAQVIAFSPMGDALYAAATKGGPWEGTDGRAFPPKPQASPWLKPQPAQH